MSCSDAKNIICKHVRSDSTFYVDMSARLLDGETISNIDAIETDDLGMTVGSGAIIALAGDYPGPCGTDVTIAAGEGISFQAAGGTPGTRATITIEVTKSSGDVEAYDLLMDVYGTA